MSKERNRGWSERLHITSDGTWLTHVIGIGRDLLVRVLVNNELLAPYGEHWVYDTPLFGLCLEATRNTDGGQWAPGGARGPGGRGTGPRAPPARSVSTSTQYAVVVQARMRDARR